MSFAPEFENEPVRPHFPTSVLIAGWIWCGYGLLTVGLIMLSLGQQGGNGASSPICPLLFGIAFLICGIQTVKGTAKDTRGNAVGSLIFGILQILVAIAIATGGFWQNRMPEEVALMTGAIVAGMGNMLVLAGILALAGRAGYREWKRAATRVIPSRLHNDD